MDELVPRECWVEFCERFTHQHHGWLGTLEYRPAAPDAVRGGRISDVGRASGARDTAEGGRTSDARHASDAVPLSEFRALEVAEQLGAQELRIRLADELGRERASALQHPVRLVFEKTADGGHSGLRLYGRDGEALILRFRTPARPEVLNGLAWADS